MIEPLESFTLCAKNKVFLVEEKVIVISQADWKEALKVFTTNGKDLNLLLLKTSSTARILIKELLESRITIPDLGHICCHG